MIKFLLLFVLLLSACGEQGTPSLPPIQEPQPESCTGPSQGTWSGITFQMTNGGCNPTFTPDTWTYQGPNDPAPVTYQVQDVSMCGGPAGIYYQNQLYIPGTNDPSQKIGLERFADVYFVLTDLTNKTQCWYALKNGAIDPYLPAPTY